MSSVFARFAGDTWMPVALRAYSCIVRGSPIYGIFGSRLRKVPRAAAAALRDNKISDSIRLPGRVEIKDFQEKAGTIGLTHTIRAENRWPLPQAGIYNLGTRFEIHRISDSRCNHS
jgi:hypothetical protein